MGAMQRRKGAAGEREAAKELTRLFGVKCHRGRQYHGGADSPDVAGGFPAHIEVKRSETFNAYAAMQQATEDKPDDAIPLVLHRRNGKPWLAVIELERLPELVVKLFHLLAGESNV